MTHGTSTKKTSLDRLCDKMRELRDEHVLNINHGDHIKAVQARSKVQILESLLQEAAFIKGVNDNV